MWACFGGWVALGVIVNCWLAGGFVGYGGGFGWGGRPNQAEALPRRLAVMRFHYGCHSGSLWAGFV